MAPSPRPRPLRIGCASGFRGDSEAGATQRVDRGAHAGGVNAKAFARIPLDMEVDVRAAVPESLR